MKIGGGTKPSEFLSGKVVAYIIIVDNFYIALFSLMYTNSLRLQRSPTFSKFHKHNTFNYDN